MRPAMLSSAMLLILLSAIATPAPAAQTIRAVGSTTVLPIVAQAARLYRDRHPQIRLTVSGGGSGVGVAAIRQGTAEIGMVSRALTPGEARVLGGRVAVIPIARDAVAVAVSRAVYLAGVHRLSLAQIAAIYRGEIRNWKEVGGPDAPILVIDKEPSRGTRHVFARAVLGDAHARAPGATIIAGSNNEEQAAIANSDQAIGMLSNAWLNDAVRAVAVIAGGREVTPSRAHVADGSYPIQRDLNVLVARDAGGAVRDFVDFLLSPAGQRVVEELGYLPVRE